MGPWLTTCLASVTVILHSTVIAEIGSARSEVVEVLSETQDSLRLDVESVDSSATGVDADRDSDLDQQPRSTTEDSSNIFLSDFLRRASADAVTCKAETPLIRFGEWGLHAYPVPYYQEEHGWEFGSMLSLTHGVPSEAPYSASVLGVYGEREDKLYGLGTLKFGSLATKPLALAAALRAESRHGRRGLSALVEAAQSVSDRSAWMSVEIFLGHESYGRLKYLDASKWEIGERSMAGIRVTYDDFGHEKPKLLGLQTEITALTEQDVLGGDFVSRRISVDLSVASSRGLLWTAGGSIDGKTPIQELFDLAVDGRIRAGAIRKYQTPSFWACGMEGRVETPIDLFALPYLTLAAGRGIDENLLEFGIGFNDSPAVAEYNPADWFVRVDFPLYSNAGLESSRRAKWDLRRIMVRVNLPLDLLSRRDEVRYRYPNR